MARRSSMVGARSPSTASTSARTAASASGLRPSSSTSQLAAAGGGVEAGRHQAAHLVEQLGVGERLAVDAGQQRGERVGVGVLVDAGGPAAGDLGQHQLVGGAVAALHPGVRVDPEVVLEALLRHLLHVAQAGLEQLAEAVGLGAELLAEQRPHDDAADRRRAATRRRRAARPAATRRGPGRPRRRRARGGRRPA